ADNHSSKNKLLREKEVQKHPCPGSRHQAENGIGVNQRHRRRQQAECAAVENKAAGRCSQEPHPLRVRTALMLTTESKEPVACPAQSRGEWKRKKRAAVMAEPQPVERQMEQDIIDEKP